MAGLGDFVGGDEWRQLHLMNIEYEEQFGKPVTHMWCRDKDNKEHHVEVVGHRPSFYIDYDAYSKRVKNHDWVKCVESRDENGDQYQSIQGERLVRVYCKLPDHVDGGYDEKGLSDYFEDTWEADISYPNRFLIDTGIKTHLRVKESETWEPQSCEGDYRVDIDDIEAVEDPDWKAEPRMVTVDIEVESPDGFPEPQDADQPVTAITAYDNHDEEYTVWVLRNDAWDRTDTEIENMAVGNRPTTIELEDDGEVVERLPVSIEDVRVYEDEADMLHNFNEYVEAKSPDLLSGWNSSTTDNGYPFDFPYLINRCKSLNTLSYNDWSPLGQVWSNNWGPGAKGVEFHDMLKAYKKTQWSKPKGGYGLENISGNELPIGKLEIEDIDNAWRDEPETFLEYNMRDVQAVVGIDKSADVTSLFQNLRKLTGAQWGDCHNNIDLLDHFILRYAKNFGVRLPTNEEPDRGWYYGAHVFEPELGRHPNAVYPDLWSMYPNMIRNCNMSPETIIGTADKLEASEYTEEDCRWSYIDTRPTSIKNPDNADSPEPDYEKVYFLKPNVKEGFMTKVVDDLMGLKDAYDGTPLYGPVKQVVNSVYGVYGDSDSYGKGYRLFDWRIAEGICLGGRLQIQDSSEKFVGALNNIKNERGIDGSNAYLVGGDTDSCMAAIPFMDVDKGEDTTTVECDNKGEMDVPVAYEDYSDIVDLAHEAADRVNDWYGEWTEETFNLEEGDHFCELEIESYAPWLFIPEGVTKEKAKKRYAEIIAWEEGEWFYPPEFSVTGIDIVRSDRAEATRDILEQVLDVILRTDDKVEARREVYDIISEVVGEIQDGERPNSYISRPKGMSEPPETYGEVDRTPMPTYKGAKYANENFDWERMTAGSKPQLLYIDKVRGNWPHTYTAETKEGGTVVDAVAVEDPNKVPKEFVVDTDKMIEKVLEDPLTPILSPMQWEFDEALADSEQGKLAGFM